MKLNQKGYMLVEIILASVLAMTIAYYLLNLTYQFKNTEEDIYQSITYENDVISITKNIMNDLDKVIIKKIKTDDTDDSNKNDVIIDLKIILKKDSTEENRRIEIKTNSNGTTLYYGKRNDENTDYITSDISYYEKALQPSLNVDVENIKTISKENYLTIEIPIFSLYEDQNYDIKLFVGKKWVNLLLKDVAVGSYVKYEGTNGCPDGHCDGTNANYVSNDDMGYCSSSKFIVNGWRIGYIQNDTAYLISAGAPECLCTNEDGTSSDSNCSSTDETLVADQHTQNLNDKAVKYCNSNYAYEGVCNSSSAWSMNENDFKMITGSELLDCYQNNSNLTACGYENDLIDNGSYYWYATAYSSKYIFHWYPDNHIIRIFNASMGYGIRPVLRLKSSIVVTAGSGTYEDPYQISN